MTGYEKALKEIFAVELECILLRHGATAPNLQTIIGRFTDDLYERMLRRRDLPPGPADRRPNKS